MLKLFLTSVDKQAHFLGGYALALTVGLATVPVAGLVAACIAGVAKEAYDKQHPDKHTADWLDLLATILGGIVGGAVALGMLWTRF